MIRAILTLALVAGGFAGGFYVGVQYGEQRMVQEPERFLEEYKQEFERTAGDKFDKIKKVLLEDT